jgi:hypothetical protein
MATNPRATRLASRHRRLLQIAFDAFEADGAWPQVARLQHELARQGERFDLRAAARDLDASYGRVDTLNMSGEVVLTVKGIRRCAGSSQVLDDVVRALAYFLRRFLEATTPPAEVTGPELQRDLQLSDLATRKIRTLLSTSGVLMLGGGGEGDSLRWLVDDRILQFRDATTIDRVIRSAYPPGWPRSTGGYLPNQGSGAPRQAGVTDWSTPPPGWGGVEARLAELRARLAIATTKDDWQDVGRRCREIMIDAANVVFRPDDLTPGGEVPGASDAKARLDAYISARAQDLAPDLRPLVVGTLRLANALTHHPRMGRLEAVTCSQAVVLMVRTLQEIDLAIPARARRHSAPGSDSDSGGIDMPRG